jgi:hypothetical protein
MQDAMTSLAYSLNNAVEEARLMIEGATMLDISGDISGDFKGNASQHQGLGSYLWRIRVSDKDPCDASQYKGTDYGTPVYTENPTRAEQLLGDDDYVVMNFVYGVRHGAQTGRRQRAQPIGTWRFGRGRPGCDELTCERGVKHFQLCQGLLIMFAGVLHLRRDPHTRAITGQVTPLSGRWAGLKEDLVKLVHNRLKSTESDLSYETNAFQLLGEIVQKVRPEAVDVFLDAYQTIGVARHLTAMWRSGPTTVTPCLLEIARSYVRSVLRAHSHEHDCSKDIVDVYA